MSDVRFRLIGINQDDRADGTGKAGLTFQAIKKYAMPSYIFRRDRTGHYKYYNGWSYKTYIDKSRSYYGWRDSLLHKDLNDNKSGRIWNSIASNDFKQRITPILKITNNNNEYSRLSSKTSNASSNTIDKLFILSPSEIGMTIVKDYNILDNDYPYTYNNSNVHYYNNEQDSYINTLKTSTSNDCDGSSYSEYDYMYAGNTYQWWMLPSGSRKMKNNNQSYHNTDLYSYVTLVDGYSMKPPSQNGSAALGSGANEFWLRSPAAHSDYFRFFPTFISINGNFCAFEQRNNVAGVVLAFAF